jgi:protein-disulfide isomerase
MVSADGRRVLTFHLSTVLSDFLTRPLLLLAMRALVSPLRSTACLLAVFSLMLSGVAACGRADAASRKAAEASRAASQTTGTPTATSKTSATAGAPTNMVVLSDTLSDSLLISKADKGRLMGRDSGTIWLVMISDFQCPYCKVWHDSSMAAVKRDYIDAGKVRMAYLNLPLPQHAHAREEAEAALCASAQNKFWPYSEALFHDQDMLSKRADVKPYLDSLARANAVEMTEFARCRKTNAIASLIESDMAQARRAGVRSTPSFLIGQFLVEGAAPYKDFRRAIDTAIVTERLKRSR